MNTYYAHTRHYSEDTHVCSCMLHVALRRTLHISEKIKEILLTSVHRIELVWMVCVRGLFGVESSKVGRASTDHFVVVVVPRFPFDQPFRVL